MSSSQAVRTSKYSYRATSMGPGAADVNIEYTADLTALARLEVSYCRSPPLSVQVYALHPYTGAPMNARAIEWEVEG